MNFRKGILALAVGALGLTGIASAQYTCTSAGLTSGTTVFVRNEGTTELVPSVTIGGCTAGAAPNSVTITVSSSAGASNQNVSGHSYTDATATFFGGAAVNGTLSGNALTFTASGASIGGTVGSGIVINGVRVNASSIPVNTAITVTAGAGPGMILNTAASTAVPVAYTQPGIAKPTVQGFANQAICSAGTAVVPILQAEISSGFNGSFAPEGSGGMAATGEYINVTFANLSAGANYYVPVSITGANTLGGLTATLVADNTGTTGQAGGNIGPSSAQVGGVYQVSLNNGSASALYWVTGADPANVDAFVVPLYAVTTSGATAGINSSPTVAAMFMSPASGYDQFAANQSPTAVAASKSATAISGLAFPTITIGGTAATTGGGQLTSCATTLLFPYILNTGGYDTGVALTNASAGTSVAQAGTCSVQFYGNGAPSTNPYVTSSVAAGAITAFTVSSAAPGFQGYAIATCNFQEAHGFAFITDGYGQPGKGLSQGYLAIVTSAAGSSVTAPF